MVVGAAAALLGQTAAIFLPSELPGKEVIGALCWIAYFPMSLLAGHFRARRTRSYGAGFIAYGLCLAGLGAWLLITAPELLEGAWNVDVLLVSAGLSLAVGLAAVLFPAEPSVKQPDKLAESWTAQVAPVKTRRLGARIVGLLGAAVGVAAVYKVFTESTIAGLAGVALVVLACWGAMLAGKSRISAFLLLIVPGLAGWFAGGLYWLPAGLLLVIAAFIEGWPRWGENVGRGLGG